MLSNLERYRKAVVAFVVGNGAAIALVTTADFSTWQGILAFVIAELGALGVYAVPNTPPAGAKKADLEEVLTRMYERLIASGDDELADLALDGLDLLTGWCGPDMGLSEPQAA